MSNFLPNQAELFDWRKRQVTVEPWEPEVLTHDQWPPNYRGVYAWRIKMLKLLTASPELLASAKAYYSQPGIGCVKFILHWMDTYNPRKTDDKWMPFILFKRQEEFIQFLDELQRDGQNGLVEKCRDAGVTWLACAYSVWSWIFTDHDAIGWGSRKQELVDRLGEPDSIFEKMRLLIDRLPPCFVPSYEAPFMRILNHENGSVISGESGDNIGRGGRKRMYMKDESAHYERPEKIEAALGNNTNIQVDISSVNGLGNVFYRRRMAGVDWYPGLAINPGIVRVFVFDWRDHPEKTPEWYEQSRAKHEREGLMHVFAQEVDRNYAASVQNTLIDLEWIKASIDAHLHIPAIEEYSRGAWSAGADIADEGIDMNALVKREGLILRSARDWGDRDPGVAARTIIDECREHYGINVQYDAIGVGSAVKAEYNRLLDDETLKRGEIFMTPWLAGDKVQFPFNNIILDDDKSPTNFDFFENMKAQAWWSLRTRFYKTWRAIKFGIKYPVDELISIDSRIPCIRQLEKELAQPTYGKSSRLKTLVNKKPDGTKSPNIADATVMCYFPSIIDYSTVATGTYANG